MPDIHRGLIVLATATVLGVISGCKTQQPPAPAPGPPQPQPLVQSARNIYIQQNEDNKPDVAQRISQNTVVTWSSLKNFTIVFKPSQDPCTDKKGSYPATQSATSDPPYSVSCTIASKNNRGDKFKYGIEWAGTLQSPAPVPPNSPRRPRRKSADITGGVNNCDGCVLEADGN